MASALSPAAPSPPPPSPALAPAPAGVVSSSSSAVAATASAHTAAAPKSRPQRAPRTKDRAPSKDTTNSSSNKDPKESRTSKKEKNVDRAPNPADVSTEDAASFAPPATKQGASKRRNPKAPRNPSQPDPAAASVVSSTPSAPSAGPSDPPLPKKQQPDEAKKNNGRPSVRKQQHAKGAHAHQTPDGASPPAAEKDSVEPASDGPATSAPLPSSSTLTPKSSEKLSSVRNINKNNTNNDGNKHHGNTSGSGDRKKSTPSIANQGKKKGSNAKEPTPAASSAVDTDAKATVDNSATKPLDGGAASAKKSKDQTVASDRSPQKVHANKDGAVGNTKRNVSSRSQGSNTDGRTPNKEKGKGGKGGKEGKDQDKSRDKDKDKRSASRTTSKAVRPSSISSSCSFVTSSSSLSPTSPTSPSSSLSSPLPSSSSVLNFLPASIIPSAAGSAAAAASTQKEPRREETQAKTRNEKLATIKTNFARDPSSPFSAPLSGGTASSPLTSAGPSSRRSSTIVSGDKFGRLGGGLSTVEESLSERQADHPSMSPSANTHPSAGAVRRGHARSLSMKEQLDQLGQDAGKGGKSIESLQEIISSLKSLPPATHPTAAQSSASGEQTQAHGASHQEKRLSLSSRSSIGPMGGAATSTTLHISQPPRGTSIENALQSTVATLRRLSVSDSRRALLPLKEDEGEATAGTAGDTKGKRRSVAFSREAVPITGDTFDSRRLSSLSNYQPNRRSVIVKPEEVAALQGGKPYMPLTFGFSSDDEPDAIADTLSALEGKGTPSNRSSYSATDPQQRFSSEVDPGSLAEFAARLPSHMRGVGAAALVNNDDAHDRRRFTTALHSTSIGSNRNSALASVGAAGTANRRLSSLPSTRASDRKDWRMSTPATPHGYSNRDSVNLRESANGRRALFAAHLTYSDFHSLLTKQKNKYVQGVLRINKRNRSDAYVTVDSLPEGDVYICGSKDRNRALEGDVVGIELIDLEELPQQKFEGNKDGRKSRRPEEVEDAGDAEVDEVKPKYCGRVVSIVERSISQMFSGTLTVQRPSGSTKKTERKKQDEDDQKDQPRIVWFKPTDKRVPLIAIPIDQAPADFIENHVSYVHKLFVASIKRWPLSSLHPFGQLERELGDIGDIEIETEALLADNNVTTTAFGEKVEKCLPEVPWTIPEKEVSRRRDLRNDCIFTIDPATAKDLDDAVSCTRLEDGTLEIGVHIADVSHFIKVGSALDREAKSRATTVYLVQKAIPMLPNVLCEDLCSLTANVDRLAFSVFWKMTEEGQILDTSFAKSIIRSCAQLSYDDAQRVIKTGSLDPKVEVVGQARSLVEDNIKTFFKLSQILRQNRFENGALSINSIKLSFETDEIHNPLNVSVYELKESNRLIEEFMLLANMSVAKQICEFFPDLALLRRHEQPHEKRMLNFISHMNKLGLDLDASSAGALQRSLDAIQDPDMRQVVRLLTVKTMNRAKYICSGVLSPDKYRHYSLNVPLYTHFTSPIRRYADIIVHRMLEASLAGDSKFYMTKESCQKSANHCNIKKDAAKLAQDQSSQVYLSVLLRNMTESKGMVVRDAIVVQVLDASFDVFVPEYGLEKRVYVDQLPLERHAWNGTSGTLKLHWTTEPFKTVVEEEEVQETKTDDRSRRLSTLSAAHHVGALDNPDDVTNAYEDERGLFDYESDYEDEDDVQRSQSNGARVNEDEGNDEDEGQDEARRLTRIRTFGHVRVLITADTTVSPPAIKVIAMNPYSASADVPTAFA